MRLATSTCIFPSRRQGGGTPLVQSIAMCRECGFEVIDLNFCFAANKNNGSKEKLIIKIDKINAILEAFKNMN